MRWLDERCLNRQLVDDGRKCWGAGLVGVTAGVKLLRLHVTMKFAFKVSVNYIIRD